VFLEVQGDEMRQNARTRENSRKILRYSHRYEEDDRDIDGQEILEQIASGAIESGKQLIKIYF